ncbi:MAG: cadmium-translocating P-type ATPase [Clostridia bacterium]|nr:cadmium-translocating P-type ATPase [Clostridia bacterium]
MTKRQKQTLARILVTAGLFAALLILEKTGRLAGLGRWLTLLLFFIPYALIAYDVLFAAVRRIRQGIVFDENLLMLIATVAAFCIGEYAEAVSVMLFYQIGELFQGVAVGRSRRSISALMEIVPAYANLLEGETVTQTDPDDVEVGDVILIRAGERVPLDGEVLTGTSMLDTAALTGESVPRRVAPGDAIVSGCINDSGALTVRVTKSFEDSAVSKILELVENASSKKAKTEQFITRFAKIYTPAVTLCALLIAVIPSLLTGNWREWLERACIFLVISCPCALVISVPLGFFGGIGAASRRGVLVKGGNYLEAAASISTLVFDKTGTLTRGEFRVTRVLPAGCDEATLLRLAALAESGSDHPVARSILAACGEAPQAQAVADLTETPGEGVEAVADGRRIAVGNARLMARLGITPPAVKTAGTVVFLAEDGQYRGAIVIEDAIRDGAAEAIAALREAGVRQCVMLSGDRQTAAQAVGDRLGLDAVHAELLPAEKVGCVEAMLAEKGPKEILGYVGDGINDAPVLTRADLGFAMGSLGSDAAIEAADIVIMDDDLRRLPTLVRIARKTMRIVRENIWFALGIKLLVMLLGALGFANMWMAVFADVGVSVLAILNAMRMLRVK